MRHWQLISLLQRGTLLAGMATVAATGGCSLVSEREPAEPRVSDTMGAGLRGIPPDSAAGVPSRKQPFWEKYRDKRVRDIDRNLGVDESGG